VRVIPAKLEWTVYVEKLTARDFDAVLIGLMSATKVDLFPTWHSSMTGPNGFNLSNYRNARVDELIERAREIDDLERAVPLYAELQNIIREDQPATFLWVPDRTVAMNSSLKGCLFSPVSTYFNIDEWYFD
jgi:peptide/nickel transport system substrate-binding protein